VGKIITVLSIRCAAQNEDSIMDCTSLFKLISLTVLGEDKLTDKYRYIAHKKCPKGVMIFIMNLWFKIVFSLGDSSTKY
jgi:hypothetical protein